MKKPLLYLILFLGSLSAISQSVPQLINYQGVARRGNGTQITNQSLGLKFRILQGSSSGIAVFSETQSASTNTLGLFTAQIGSASNLGAVTWSATPYFLEVSIDTTGGSNYTLLGTQQLVSVPYAMYAGGAPSPALSYNNNILTVGSNSVGIFVGGSSPSLTVNGNSLSISGGNTVSLPTITITASGASTASPIANGYNIHTDSVTVTGPGSIPIIQVLSQGLLSIMGGYPNFQICVSPTVAYSQSTGFLVLTNTQTAQSFSYYITPTPGLTAGTDLYIGPTSNYVDLQPIAPWRYSAAGTVTLGSVANQSVGINNVAPNPPTAELEVTGFTKLGSSAAPAIKMVKLTGTTANAISTTTTISFSTYTTASKILAVSVMVEMTSGNKDWINPGYSNALGFDFDWHVNNTTNNIEVINTANSVNITNHAIQILITYGP